MSIIILSLDYMNFNVCLLLKNTTTILYSHTINTFGAFLLVHIKIYLKKRRNNGKLQLGYQHPNTITKHVPIPLCITFTFCPSPSMWGKM
jgi:hypothetical protein